MTSRRTIETLDDICDSLFNPGTFAVPDFDPEEPMTRRRPRDGEPKPEPSEYQKVKDDFLKAIGDGPELKDNPALKWEGLKYEPIEIRQPQKKSHVRLLLFVAAVLLVVYYFVR